MAKSKLIKKMRKFFDRSFWMFALIGCINTAVSLSMQFAFYTWFDMDYWFSTATAFLLSSILSYGLNKRFSFKNKDKIPKTAVKFALVIAVCYLFAYSIAKPFSEWILNFLNISDNIDFINKLAMLIGQVVFAMFNYTGQRFFTFNKKDSEGE